MNKFKYHWDSSRKTVFKLYAGNITLEDIRSSWEYAIANNLIPKETVGFVLDYREASLQVKVDSYEAIADFYWEHVEVFGGTKIAIISTNPRDIVIPMLVETRDNGYMSKPFSTVEAALEWILS
ncbi:hypothetical protein [Mangrovibacterium lignilyticum]|uniref:hypothetical protein n=1 Tax=Mangrovibacterium lignilyticum TaxID=2668052 RepID=UPI0013CF9C6A|nr:hypothetical protein [Mangrovibacterium lignilyticum]